MSDLGYFASDAKQYHEVKDAVDVLELLRGLSDWTIFTSRKTKCSYAIGPDGCG